VVDRISELLIGIFAEPQLSDEFQKLCADGKLRGEGRRISYFSSGRAARIKVREEIETRYEPIPATDWSDLSLIFHDGTLRLEGSRKCYTPALGYKMAGWACIHFEERDLLEFSSRVLAARKGRPSSKREAIAAFMKKKAISPSTPAKQIARDFQRATGRNVSGRTIRRALGRK
jgi:hypothetical protein